jgi:Holliday junction resolvase
MKESEFWRQVKVGLEAQGAHLSRIENTAGSGIPDVNACRGGVEVWIELKIFHGRRLYFRNSQRSWIFRRDAAGGQIFVLARKDERLFLYCGIDCVRVSSSSMVGDKSFSVLDVDLPNPIYSCMKPFKWPQIRDAIFGTTSITET